MKRKASARIPIVPLSSNSSSSPLTTERYEQHREQEVAQLERHYDFNSVKGIESIPVKKSVQTASIGSHTGEVYYYLQKKAYEHEKAGNIELAILCLKKSNALIVVNEYSCKPQSYNLVRLLAREGRIEEAEAEKKRVDTYYDRLGEKIDRTAHGVNSKFLLPREDLVIMSVHGSTCPECAKYQGRVYSISGRNKHFPKVPPFFFGAGCVHKGCGHIFSSYIDGVTDPMLEYTLSAHPLKNNQYGRNIVAFSNRPFVDDRTDECVAAAALVCSKAAAKATEEQNYYDNIIEVEVRRGREARDFKWLQDQFPSKCPKSLTGYRRMKTQNTKNFQILHQLAADAGKELTK